MEAEIKAPLQDPEAIRRLEQLPDSITPKKATTERERHARGRNVWWELAK